MAYKKTTNVSRKEKLNLIASINKKVAKGYTIYETIIDGIELTAFERSIDEIKKHPNRPDLSFFSEFENDKGELVREYGYMSLWMRKSEKGNIYYSGLCNDKNVVGFIDKKDNAIINLYRKG